MFPIDEPSRYGYSWVVYEGDVAELVKDVAYIKNYLRGAKLLALSWGWDLYNRKNIPNPSEIRVGRVGLSGCTRNQSR